jgi:hypothetical protein
MSSALLGPLPSGVRLFHAGGVPSLTSFEVEFGYDAMGLGGWAIRQGIGRTRAALAADGALAPDARRLALDMLGLMDLRRFVTGPMNLGLLCLLAVVVGALLAGAESTRTAGAVLLALGAAWALLLLALAWWAAARLADLSRREAAMLDASVNRL